MDREKVRKWIKTLIERYPDKLAVSNNIFDTLLVAGCNQYCFSIYANGNFLDYSKVSNENTVYIEKDNCVEFLFWNELWADNSEFIVKCNCYKDLEKNALKLYDYVQKVLREKRKQERIKMIEEL